MNQYIENLKLFISSPSDVLNERDILTKSIDEINKSIKDTLSISIDPVNWRDFIPETPLPEHTIQEILNKKIYDCQIFILILDKRDGSREKGKTKSNTQREVEVALNLLEHNRKFKFLAYFKNLNENNDPGKQLKAVVKFRKYLCDKGVWYKDYKNEEDFKEKIIHDIYRTIFSYKFSKDQKNALKKFWQFGDIHKENTTTLAIIYPAIGRHYMGSQDSDKVWLNRLEPNIVFEDFKAIQKIEKCLGLIGFHSYKICNSEDIPDYIDFINRFWICLPRNYSGRQYKEKYDKIANFNITRNSNRVILKWRNKKSKFQFFNINSPLSKYLNIQRTTMDINCDWHHDLDRIIAKDYAVLTRYKSSNNLFDYFLAGIRGLGTWGAAWYIDHEFEIFNHLNPENNIELLLEVTYKNGVIVEVANVSSKPVEYFENENNLKTIKKRIKDYNPRFIFK
jgi:hypothetical protein